LFVIYEIHIWIFYLFYLIDPFFLKKKKDYFIHYIYDSTGEIYELQTPLFICF
jgi:hypothetical protein